MDSWSGVGKDWCLDARGTDLSRMPRSCGSRPGGVLDVLYRAFPGSGRDRGDPWTFEGSSSSSAVWTVWRSDDVAGQQPDRGVDSRCGRLRTTESLSWTTEVVHDPSPDEGTYVPTYDLVVHSCPQVLWTTTCSDGHNGHNISTYPSTVGG